MKEFDLKRLNNSHYVNEERLSVDKPDFNIRYTDVAVTDFGPYTIDNALRKDFRQACLRLGISYKEHEHQGFTSFLLTGKKSSIHYLLDKLTNHGRVFDPEEWLKQRKAARQSNKSEPKNNYLLYLSLAVNALLIASHFI